MDRIRVPWFGTPSWSPGPHVRLLREEELAPEVLADARLRRDFARFERFADGWLARAPGEPDVIGDARYSSADARFELVWGIRFTPGSADVPIEWVDRSRQRRIDLRALWTELRGADPRYRPIAPVAQCQMRSSIEFPHRIRASEPRAGAATTHSQPPRTSRWSWDDSETRWRRWRGDATRAHRADVPRCDHEVVVPLVILLSRSLATIFELYFVDLYCCYVSETHVLPICDQSSVLPHRYTPIPAAWSIHLHQHLNAYPCPSGRNIFRPGNKNGPNDCDPFDVDPSENQCSPYTSSCSGW